ncbi:tRNA uridine-5-carboxymethylaminomethyl(34) synthesis GTPase MnmE [Halieaceae bacterium]|nr:tRNA uridine-5-carboxymethylaminomethyl(34) synthesis GTPase MnmE [Halieaceae bacterium]
MSDSTSQAILKDEVNYSDGDTIAAIATAPGRAGVGIIRISGPDVHRISKQIVGKDLTPRYAHYADFFAELNGRRQAIDSGLVLFFKGPNSFTGEDILELQGHGGPVILDSLLQEAIRLGARMARPGEFSERAFLNNKIDLAQAEAIADLIDSASQSAASNALRSLQGAFSKEINTLVAEVTKLRVYVEAAIDFPEEEIDFLADGHVALQLEKIIEQATIVQQQAQQGRLIQEGMRVVIAGRPNAGKSSLLNALSGQDTAIVTDIEGTTRDVLREQIQIDGMPLHIIDTAGLRQSNDSVEQEGIRRAWNEIESADSLLIVVDSSSSLETDPINIWPEIKTRLSHRIPVTVIHNKSDLSGLRNETTNGQNSTVISLSAKTGDGLQLLRQHLKNQMGFEGSEEGHFSARRRHLSALAKAVEFMLNGKSQLLHAGAGELLAEDLRLCQQSLGEITGEFSSDDLLGEIFSSFCIGK